MALSRLVPQCVCALLLWWEGASTESSNEASEDDI